MAELCPSEGRHDPCIQSLHWVQRILRSLHERYSSWREHVPLVGGTPSSRGTLHTGEVGPSGGRNPRVRYEGGGWVGRGNRRGGASSTRGTLPIPLLTAKVSPKEAHHASTEHPEHTPSTIPNTQNPPPVPTQPPFCTHKTPATAVAPPPEPTATTGHQEHPLPHLDPPPTKEAPGLEET